ncbi:MAG: DNA alkylation repair protein [Candidatus Micrarchaeota archaeon]
MIEQTLADIKSLENPEKAKVLQGFFKTKKGEYAEGDIFLGITVPQSRVIAKKYNELKIEQIQTLLSSKIHEHRLIALFILIEKYKKAKTNEGQRKQIADFYLTNTKNINNWDLVDTSAHYVLGNYTFDKDKKIIYELAKSTNIWERRIAIISTLYFIRQNKFEDTIKIAEILLNDKHDLIQKAVGWMLREVGKKNQGLEEEFLNKYSKKMPRTMLRYAIEKFSDDKKAFYMRK